WSHLEPIPSWSKSPLHHRTCHFLLAAINLNCIPFKEGHGVSELDAQNTLLLFDQIHARQVRRPVEIAITPEPVYRLARFILEGRRFVVDPEWVTIGGESACTGKVLRSSLWMRVKIVARRELNKAASQIAVVPTPVIVASHRAPIRIGTQATADA